MFDVAIIGTGPAGLSAAITLKMREKSVLWFGPADMSAKVEKAEKIANYPGAGVIGGRELNGRFRAHAQELGLETVDRLVTTVTKTGGRFMLLAENEVYEARSVLLATGVVTSRGVPGEAELLGRGVSYCATCDGMFYRGKAIAVYCAGSRYAHEVEYLAGVASKVYLYSPERDLAVGGENVERLERPIAGVEGHDRVESVRLGDGREIPVDGAFFLRSAISPASLVPGLALDGPHIVVDRQLRTGIEGCFAAGDCTGRPYQIAKAVGEGNVAAHQILEYLAGTL